MSLVVDAASTPTDGSGDRPVAPGHPVEARRRGRTTVAIGAVETIVGHLAVETDGVSAAQLTGVRGWFTGGRADHATTHVDDADDGLHIRLEVAVTYPEPVGEVVERLRTRITTRMRDRLDLRVARVDVTVTELRPPPRTHVPIDRSVR